jgi:hypothetical protein
MAEPRLRLQHPAEPEPTYADIAVLLNTNPGGQGWQTVTKKRHQKAPKAQAQVTPLPLLKAARRTPLEARRLILRRGGGLEAPKAECQDIILELNTTLTKAGLPEFLRVVDLRSSRTRAIFLFYRNTSEPHATT